MSGVLLQRNNIKFEAALKIGLEQERVTLENTNPAQFCACRFSRGLESSSSLSTEISSVLICFPDHDPVSVGSGLGNPPTSFIPQKIGYLAKARFPYLVDTPTAPKPFW